MILASHTSPKWCSPGDLDKIELESFQHSCPKPEPELGIKEGTVRNIVKNIYSKMNVGDRSQFIKKLTP